MKLHCFLLVLVVPACLAAHITKPKRSEHPAYWRLYDTLDWSSRNFYPNARNYRLWTNFVVPYVVDSGFSQSNQNEIRAAMDHVENNSCLKFEPVSGTPSGDYVEVQKIGGEASCSAYLGVQQNRGKHEVMMHPDCFNWDSEDNVFLHELMHSLGFHHEHTRPDRDDFVTVTSGGFNNNKHPWSDVGAGVLCHEDMLNEELCKQEIYGKYLTYDLNSVTHYPPWAGITANDGTDPFGVYNIPFGLSAMDVDKLNSFFGCPNAKYRVPVPMCKQIQFTQSGSSDYANQYSGGIANYWDGIYKQDGTYIKDDPTGLLYPVYRNINNNARWLARGKSNGRWYISYDGNSAPGSTAAYLRQANTDPEPMYNDQVEWWNWSSGTWQPQGGYTIECLDNAGVECDAGWWGSSTCFGTAGNCARKCYKIVNGLTDGGAAAQTTCSNSDRPDAILAEPRNIQEFNYIQAGLNSRSSETLWVGIVDTASEGDYRYLSDNSQVFGSSITWASGQPDDWSAVGGEDCMVMNPVNGNYLLNDHACDYHSSWRKNAVCEYTLSVQ